MSLEPTTLALERFVLGELPEAEHRAIHATLAADRTLGLRVDALRASNREILNLHPSASIGAVIRQRAGQTRLRRQTLAPALALATVLGSLVIAIVLGGGAPVQEAPNPLRVKGPAAALRIFRKTAEGSESLSPGARAFKGDVLRVGYQTFGPRYGVIVSIDGRNKVTRHWPSRGDMAAPLQGGGLVLLDEAFELDDAPWFERFYLMTSDHSFSIDRVLVALRSGGGEQQPAALVGLDLVSVELQKELSR